MRHERGKEPGLVNVGLDWWEVIELFDWPGEQDQVI